MCEKHRHRHLSCANRSSISLSVMTLMLFKLRVVFPNARLVKVLGVRGWGSTLIHIFSLSLPGSEGALLAKFSVDVWGVGGEHKRTTGAKLFKWIFFSCCSFRLHKLTKEEKKWMLQRWPWKLVWVSAGVLFVFVHSIVDANRCWPISLFNVGKRKSFIFSCKHWASSDGNILVTNLIHFIHRRAW